MKPKKNGIFAFVKKAMALCLTVVMIAGCIGLTGCSPSASNDERTAVSSKFLGETLLTQIKEQDFPLNCDTLCSYGEEQFSKNFEYLYGIPEEYVSDGFILYASSGQTADEVSLLQPADAGKGALIQNALTERIEQRKRDFNGYNDQEVKKLEQAVVKPIGTKIALIVANNPDAVLQVLRQTLKQQTEQNETENDK